MTTKVENGSSIPTDSLDDWRLQALNWILRGQFPFWVLAYAVGIWNTVQTYQEKVLTSADSTLLFVAAVSIYTVLLAIMATITVAPKLGYRLRAAMMLAIYLLLSIALFSLSALSGDARGFLFAFVTLAAIFLDTPWNVVSLIAALLTFAGMGWLNVSGTIRIAAEYGYDATEPTAWISGGAVFAALGISTSLGISYLQRAFVRSLSRARLSLQNERRTANALRMISEINQLIVRERRSPTLLEQTCQAIVHSGYAYVWLELRQPNIASMGHSFCAGADHSPLPLPDFAAQAFQTRLPVFDPPALAIPILRAERIFGLLVVAHEHIDQAFDRVETNLLQELADDLAYAIENIEIETQRRAIAETSIPLLTASDESAFWSAAMNTLQTTLKADRAAIYIYELGADSLTCPYAIGLSQDYTAEVARRFREFPGARILRNSQPVAIQDIETDPAVAALRPLFQREGIRAYAIFPLFSAEQLLGALAAYRNAPLPFSQPDLDAGQTLAHLAAASLQNTRLFQEIRAKAAEQAALFSAAQEISASLLNPPALLVTLATQLAGALAATSVFVFSLDSPGETFSALAEYWSDSASADERMAGPRRSYPVNDLPHIARSMKAGKTLTLHADGADLTEAERKEYRAYGVCTKLFVPLLAQGQLVGYTEIWESRKLRDFTSHEIYLAQAISSHAANIIRITNLYAELEKRESYFRALTENSIEGVAVINADGRFLYMSRQEEKMLGYSHLAVVGHDAFGITHPEDLQRVRDAFNCAVQDANNTALVEYRARHANGSWRYLEVMFKNLLEAASVRGVVANFRDITERKQAEKRLLDAYDSTLEGWARVLELRDKDTEGHTRRVTELAVALARAMNLSNEQITHLRRGAILHDIGKMAIPDRILHKPAALTFAEAELMRRHPQFAYEMLFPIEHLRPAMDIPYCHHEKWDGSGYPRGLKGEEIPLAARIFAVVDVYDALTSDRSYRRAWSRDQTAAYILEHAGSIFDPQIAHVFLAEIVAAIPNHGPVAIDGEGAQIVVVQTNESQTSEI